jgi:hypothetical protein
MALTEKISFHNFRAFLWHATFPAFLFIALFSLAGAYANISIFYF